MLVVEVFLDLLQLASFDRQCPRILVHAITGKHPDIDNGSVHPGRDPQGSVLNIRCLLAKNSAQQLFFRCQLGFALWRDLAHQDIAGIDFRPDKGDSRFVEIGQRRIADIGNIRADFFGAQLGIARHTSQLFDVDRGKAILVDQALRDQDGILEVVAVPRHERDHQVLSQRQFAHVG